MSKAEHAKPKKKKWVKWLIIVPLALIGVLCVAAGGVAYYILSKPDIDVYKKPTTYDGQDILDHSLPEINENEGSDPGTLPTLPAPSREEEEFSTGSQSDNPYSGMSLQEAMRRWCANGEAVSSSRVYNILLIGVDDGRRADSMMLMSINHDWKKITFASLLRDQFTYINTGKHAGYEKLNYAYFYGGGVQAIKTIEAHYKVQIDNYAAIDLAVFPSVIDRLGGVSMTLTQAEADALGMTAGTHQLTGKQTLHYARLRKIDSEEARTGRQRKVMMALLQKARNLSLSDMSAIVEDVLPNIKTGLSKGEMLNMAAGFVGTWRSYSTQQMVMPIASDRIDDTIGGLFFWRVDYPRAAYSLQMALYGKSNITLASGRKRFTQLYVER